jgi:hypothetical protein
MEVLSFLVNVQFWTIDAFAEIIVIDADTGSRGPCAKEVKPGCGCR